MAVSVVLRMPMRPALWSSGSSVVFKGLMLLVLWCLGVLWLGL